VPTGLTIVKKFAYRANLAEEFSNTYWFSGSTPADDTAWAALAAAVAGAERAVYTSAVSIVAYYGYDDDSDDRHSIWSADMHASGSLPGTFTTGLYPAPGDAAAWVRWETSRRTSKGKKIYLRKYFHDVHMEDGTHPDQLATTQKTAYTTFGTKLRDGTLLDARKIVGRGHSTDVIVGSSASTYITTRTLKRRPKRPPP